MKTTLSYLSNVEFTPATLAIKGSGLCGHLEVTDEVRDTYFTNTRASLAARAQARAQASDLPIGLVVVHADENTEGNVVVRLSSMDDEDIAGEVEFGIDITQTPFKQLTVKFTPLQLVVHEAFAGRGHALDLISAACWLSQDIAACLFSEAEEGAEISLAVACASDNTADLRLAQGLAATAAITGEALSTQARMAVVSDLFPEMPHAA